MQIHQLDISATKKRKRVARGGKRGTYAGRGCKGQKSRSGGNVDPLFEGGRSSLVQRMKKNRGFKSPHAKSTVIRISTLDQKFEDGETVSVASLLEKKILRAKNKTNGVRIVAGGEIAKKLTIDASVTVTEAAKAAIEKAGGTTEDQKAS